MRPLLVTLLVFVGAFGCGLSNNSGSPSQGPFPTGMRLCLSRDYPVTNDTGKVSSLCGDLIVDRVWKSSGTVDSVVWIGHHSLDLSRLLVVDMRPRPGRVLAVILQDTMRLFLDSNDPSPLDARPSHLSGDDGGIIGKGTLASTQWQGTWGMPCFCAYTHGAFSVFAKK